MACNPYGVVKKSFLILLEWYLFIFPLQQHYQNHGVCISTPNICPGIPCHSGWYSMIQAHVPLRIVQFVVISNVWSTFVNFSLVEFEAIFFCCYLPAIFSQTLNADSKIRSPKKKKQRTKLTFEMFAPMLFFFDVNRNMFYLFSFISPTRLRFQSKSTVPFCQLCQLNSKSRLYFNYELFKNVRGRKKPL